MKKTYCQSNFYQKVLISIFFFFIKINCGITQPWITATKDRIDEIFVDWNIIGTNGHYKIYRSTNKENITENEITERPGHEFNDRNNVAGISYYYRIKRNGLYSPIAEGRRLAIAGTFVPTQYPNNTTSNTINLKWTAMLGATSYQIQVADRNHSRWTRENGYRYNDNMILDTVITTNELNFMIPSEYYESGSPITLSWTVRAIYGEELSEYAPYRDNIIINDLPLGEGNNVTVPATFEGISLDSRSYSKTIGNNIKLTLEIQENPISQFFSNTKILYLLSNDNSFSLDDKKLAEDNLSNFDINNGIINFSRNFTVEESIDKGEYYLFVIPMLEDKIYLENLEAIKLTIN